MSKSKPADIPNSELAVQAEFFDFPDDPGLVEKVKAFVHTGKIVTKDDEFCDEVCRAILAGAKSRAVARHFRISRNSIRAITAHMEAAGKLEPLKQRLAADCFYAAGLGIENSIELLHQGKFPAAVLPTLVGVFMDKGLLLTGSATVITETKREISAADVQVAFEALGVAPQAPLMLTVESVSVEEKEKPQ